MEMKSINIDARVVNFMLAFNGLSPLLVGPKVNFFQINMTKKAANNVRTCWTRSNKNVPTLIKFVLEKAKNGPKIFWGAI
jgi:hypothetical protein